MPKLSDIVAMDGVALSHAIQGKRVSCVEVMAAYLDHIEALNPTVNAIVSLQDRGDLLAQAKTRDDEIAAGTIRGWMHGFPHAVKDLTATKGIRTTQGSRIFKDFVPAADAIMVERLKAAGAIIIGKTNTPEFGLGSNTYNDVFGKTLNAYDQSKTAGGSSGGAGVALALHMLPVADGSDHGGSLRNPAAFNNVFGFRPSYGRVPSQGVDMLYAWMGVQGPMARTVPDLARLLSVQAGYDPRMPLSNRQDPAAFAQDLKRDFKGARIAWSGDFGGLMPFEPGVLDLCKSALKTFETLGATVEEAWPDFPIERIFPTWLKLRAWQSGTQLKDFYNDPAKRALMKPEAQFEVESGAKLSAYEVYRRLGGPHRVVSGDAGVLPELRLLHPAGRPGVPVRRQRRLAEDDRRQDHGHLSPLDGGDDPGHDGCRSRDRGTGGLRRQRIADGPADHGAEPRRAGVAAACQRLRRSDAVGDEAPAAACCVIRPARPAFARAERIADCADKRTRRSPGPG